MGVRRRSVGVWGGYASMLSGNRGLGDAGKCVEVAMRASGGVLMEAGVGLVSWKVWSCV